MGYTKEEILRNLLGEGDKDRVGIPHWWRKDANSNLYGIFDAFAEQMANLSLQADNQRAQIFVDTAEGSALDDLSKIFRLARFSGESDDAFRARIKAYWISFTGGGTIQAIKNAVAIIAGLTPGDIDVIEDFSIFGEEHRWFTGGTDRIRLNHRDADPTTMTVEGLVGGVPFIFTYGIDFDYERQTNNIIFNIGGTNPDNNSIITFDYDYRNVLITKVIVPLTPPVAPDMLSTLRTIIDQVKAAGIFIIKVWLISRDDLDEAVNLTDMVTIIEPEPNDNFIIEVSYIEGDDVLG